MSCRYYLLESQWAVSINIFPQNLNSMVTHTGQDRAQNISPTFTVTLECGDPAIGSQISQLLYIIWPWQSHFSSHDKQEIAANCEKYIRAQDTQMSLMIFSSEFKLVKPFVFLSFIFESTDRYTIFHMTHSWQLCCCSMRQICCDLMIRN